MSNNNQPVPPSQEVLTEKAKHLDIEAAVSGAGWLDKAKSHEKTARRMC